MDIDNFIKQLNNNENSLDVLVNYIKYREHRQKLYEKIKDNHIYYKLHLYILFFEKEYDVILSKADEYKNDPFYTNILGLVYKKQEKLTDACKFFKMAGEMGYARGYVYLGMCFMEGEMKNYDEALKYFKLASELGHGFGHYMLGICCHKTNYVESHKYFKLAGETGCGLGYISLGGDYENGIGVVKDYVKANEYFKMAGECGFGIGYFRLGKNYARGLGLKCDYTEANKYYKMAGECGISLGYYELGNSYEKGNGVDKNLDEAIKYYSIAIDMGESLDKFTAYQLKLVEYYKKNKNLLDSQDERDKYMNKLISDGKIGIVEGLVSQYL